jgi:hypothetical protein
MQPSVRLARAVDTQPLKRLASAAGKCSVQVRSRLYDGVVHVADWSSTPVEGVRSVYPSFLSGCEERYVRERISGIQGVCSGSGEIHTLLFLQSPDAVSDANGCIDAAQVVNKK